MRLREQHDLAPLACLTSSTHNAQATRGCAVASICKLQAANCKLQTADCKHKLQLQTANAHGKLELAATTAACFTASGGGESSTAFSNSLTARAARWFNADSAFPQKYNNNTNYFSASPTKATFQSGFYVRPADGCVDARGAMAHTGHPPGHHKESARKSNHAPTLSPEALLDAQKKTSLHGVSVGSLVAELNEKMKEDGIAITAEELRTRLRGRGERLLESTLEDVQDPVLEHLHVAEERTFLRELWRQQHCYVLTRCETACRWRVGVGVGGLCGLADRCLQFATCSLWIAVCSLQFAVCGLRLVDFVCS